MDCITSRGHNLRGLMLHRLRTLDNRMHGLFLDGSRAFFVMGHNTRLGFLDDDLLHDDDHFAFLAGGLMIR